jgi:23S rRNA U2552 (ribose-2'-O)-methylase RlmE/FtsJ
MNDPTTVESFEAQLEALYAEREMLASELGCCDAEGIIDMMQNLEAQLCDMYDRFGGVKQVDTSASMQLLSHVQDLSEQLDGLYSERSLTFTVENGEPVLKAIWTENLTEGDQ